MPEREKVIKGLECCLEDEARDLKCWEDGDFPECPYNDRVDGCMGRLNRDALALLKAQEPKHGHWILHDDEFFPWFECCKCGFTGMATRYCAGCGAKMDGDADG